MGGRALNNYGITTVRKTTDEFNRIADNITQKINHDLGIETSIVKCYHNKETHGDLDILLKIDNIIYNKNVNLKEYVKNTFNPNAIHNNGGVFSFDYDQFQIDFIPIKESNWETAKVYFSYDPLGNAMGKTFHKLNLSYGWDGLKYKYRNFNGRNSHNILISKNPQKIFEFGGYNYNRYLNGFDDIEEIFDFIIDGEYFNSDIFRMENLKHIDKKRNRKRKSYHEFLKYINDNNIKSKHEFNKDKSIYLPLINDFFPEANFYNKLKELDEKNELNKKVNEKFNGNIIMNLIPSLSGKELGNFITEFKNSLGDDYKNKIVNMSEEDVKTKILNEYNR